MYTLYVIVDNEGEVKEVEYLKGDYSESFSSEYNRRSLRGKMQRWFGKDAFSKGYIKVFELNTQDSHERVLSYEQLREGN